MPIALRAIKGEEDSRPSPSRREREGLYRLLTREALIGAVRAVAFPECPLALRATKGDEDFSARPVVPRT